MDSQTKAQILSAPFSSHGLVRLSLDTMLSLSFSHLASGVDSTDESSPAACGKATSLTGYTEWVSTGEPCVTIGWDWSIRITAADWSWIRIGPPRSNIVVVDHEGNDYEWTRNLDLLGTLADALPWKEHLPHAVSLRYV